MINRKYRVLFIVFLGLLIVCTSPYEVFAQEEGFRIHLRKDFGYSWGSQIQGRFTLSIIGDVSEVTQVAFHIDDNTLAIITEAPFHHQFHTGEFDAGKHRLSAEVSLEDGSIQSTPMIVYDFLSPTQMSQQVTTVLLRIGGLILVLFLIGVIIQTLLLKTKKRLPHKPGAPRNYGYLGGTICPKCERPFPRHLWGINLIVSRLDRCEHCGRWVMTKRASEADLRAAESAEASFDQEERGDQKTKTDTKAYLEETKYIDQL